MIMIAGYIPGITILNVSRGMRKTIPDRFTLPILIPSTFDLIGGTRNTPKKTIWEGDLFCGRAHRFRSILYWFVTLALTFWFLFKLWLSNSCLNPDLFLL